MKPGRNAPQSPALPVSLRSFSYSQPTLIHLRDGEVVLYRRNSAVHWQCRYKLQDGTWHRTSTRQASIEGAVAAACLMYDEARFRQRLGLAHTARSFAQIANATLAELRTLIDAGQGKSVYATYITCIERYFVPYFGERRLEELRHTDIAQFEAWRNRQMGKAPKASTLNNFASAWSRLLQTAVSNGWTSEKAAIPRLSTRGEKSKSMRKQVESSITTVSRQALLQS